MNRIEVTPKEWAENLRKWERPQTTGILSDQAGDCCLGVLAQLGGFHERTDGRLYVLGYVHGLPGQVRPKWMSIRQEKRAAELNDEFGYTFPEIADWVDEQWNQ